MDEHGKVLELILKSEGGLNEDEPAHVGGVSYAGITQQAYDAWVKSYNIDAPKSVRGLATFHTVVNNFYTDYFTKYHVWELPECLQYMYADFVVNAGSAAVKIIQRFVGVDDDGAWGKKTSNTTRAVAEWKARVEAELVNDPNLDNNLITEFHEQKLLHYNRLATENPDKYAKYLPGWKRRCNNVLSDLGEYFENDKPTPKAVDEDDVSLQEPELVIGSELKHFSDTDLVAEVARRFGIKG